MNTFLLAPVAIAIGAFAALAPVGGYMQEARESREAHCSPNIGCEILLTRGVK